MIHIQASEKYPDMREVRIEHAEMIHDEYAIPDDWKFAAKDEVRGAGWRHPCHQG
jgi:hypothetical protein